MGAVSKTYHFPKPRQEKERMPKAMFSPEGRLIEPYKGYRGNIKWRDANVHGDAVNYGAAKIAQSHANAAQAETDKQKAYSDAIKNRFIIRDSLNKPPPPDRFMNMAKNQQARSMGMGSAGMLDTPPGVKPILSNTRPPDLGNPDFIGPQKPGTGWQDRGSSPYQRIMENRDLGQQGAREYFDNNKNSWDPSIGLVHRPEKGIVTRYDLTPKYAAEEGKTPDEMMQIRQAADLRTAAIDQAKENQYEKWAREDSQEKLKADAEKYKIDMVTKGKTDAALTKVQSEKQKRITDMMLEMKDNIAFKEEIQATKDQLRTAYKAKKQKVSEQQLETQALRSIAMRYEGQMPVADNKSAGNKKTGKDKPDNSLASLRQGARDKALNDTSNSGGDFMDRFRNPVLNNRDLERAWNAHYANEQRTKMLAAKKKQQFAPVGFSESPAGKFITKYRPFLSDQWQSNEEFLRGRF